ncbi:MAG: AAA family ATPase [Desulfovibrio sp.]|nr:AAA family ATPase [Desulfovibrio sp.]MBI4959714.1 AAA family ATPase [Desulfovibrio sp.]
MIRRLTLTDFMAHAATTLELAPGLNVLCGPNNTGKSAVVEALRCLANNPTPRHYIRHGAVEARVEALLDDGWRVVWVRRKAYALYEVYPPGAKEPTVYAKLGRGTVPDEVASLLKLGPVGADKGDEVDVHLGDQRHPIFLLDKPGSLLADFLASSTESAHLMAMQDLLRERSRRAKIDARKLEDETARVRAGLDRLVGLPDVSLSLDRLRTDGRAIRETIARVPALENTMERMQTVVSKTASLEARTGRLRKLTPPPVPAPAAELAETLRSMDVLGRKRDAVQAGLELLAPLAPPPDVVSTIDLAATVVLTGELRSRTAKAKARLEAFASLSPAPITADPAPLAELLGSLESVRARVANGKEWLNKREQDLALLAETISIRLKEAEECPLCGAGLDAERFLKKAGNRGTP